MVLRALRLGQALRLGLCLTAGSIGLAGLGCAAFLLAGYAQQQQIEPASILPPTELAFETPLNPAAETTMPQPELSGSGTRRFYTAVERLQIRHATLNVPQ